MEYTATAATSEIQQAVMECRMQNGSLNKKQQRWPIYADATTSTKTQHARRPQQEKMSARSRELPPAPTSLAWPAGCCKPQLATARAPQRPQRSHWPPACRFVHQQPAWRAGGPPGCERAAGLGSGLGLGCAPRAVFRFLGFWFSVFGFFEHKVALGPGFRA